MKATVIYTDNTTTTISEDLQDLNELVDYAEQFFSQIKNNNNIICAGNDSKRTLINFSHVKYILFEKDEN